MSLYSDPHIRLARPEEAAVIADLVNSGYRGESSRQGWTTEDGLLGGTRINEQGVRNVMARPGTAVLVYLEEREILSCVELDLRGEKIYLGMLTVRPVLQNRGLGKIMLNAGEEHARQMGCREITMLVIDERAELIAWYARRGYHPTGNRRPFDNTDPVFGLPKKPLRFMELAKVLD